MRLRCVSCGWSSESTVGAESVLAGWAAGHLRVCPARFIDHPAFGFESRWQHLRNPDLVEIAWTNRGWGLPFDLTAVAAPTSEFGAVRPVRTPPTSAELFERLHAAADDIDRFGPSGLRRIGLRAAETLGEQRVAVEVLRWCGNHALAWPMQGIE